MLERRTIAFLDSRMEDHAQYSAWVLGFHRMTAEVLYFSTTKDCLSALLERRAEVFFVRLHNKQLMNVSPLSSIAAPQGPLDLIRQARANNLYNPIFLILDQLHPELENEALLAGASEILVYSDIRSDVLERCTRFSYERYRLKMQLMETESRFRGVFNSSPQFMILVNDSGNVVDINHTALEKMELPSRRHVIGRPLESLPFWKSKRNFTPVVKDAFDSTLRGLECSFTIPLSSRMGRQVEMLFCFKPISIPGEPTMILVEASDVTQLKTRNRELEQKVRERTKRMEESRRFAEEATMKLLESNHHRSRFLANMSHELRTPLNSILGFSDLLKGAHFGPLNEKQLAYVNQIERSGNHLLSLINDLLDLSKIDSGALKLHYSSVSLEELIQSCMDMVMVQAVSKNLYLRLEHEEPLGTIQADPQRLRQILLNLLTNAVKYTSEGGIIVRGDYSDRGTLTISVEDTGIGVRAADQEEIFSEFFQADRVRDEKLGGTGIGLAITKRLVELHGGQIGLRSVEGVGSTFWFKLPKRSPENSTSSGMFPKPSLTNLHSRTAILALKDRQVLSALQELLQLMDFRNVIAQNQQELLDLLQFQNGRFIFLEYEQLLPDAEETLATILPLAKNQRLDVIGLVTHMETPQAAFFHRQNLPVLGTKPFFSSKLFEIIQRLDDELEEELLN
ncbi:MAG: ATP-binding protein [Candidatus Sumerlaeia bacterium]|nr:ATP-binding protein [Candidatus Sumerlaeia bacterium]